MKLNAIQVAGLRVFASAWQGPAQTARTDAAASAGFDVYVLGKIQGKAELARELLQAHADSQVDPVDCDLTGAARR